MTSTKSDNSMIFTTLHSNKTCLAKSVNKNMDKNLFYHDYILTSTSGF